MKPEFSIAYLKNYVRGELGAAEARVVESAAAKDPVLHARIAVLRMEADLEAEQGEMEPPKNFKKKMGGIWDDLEKEERESEEFPMIHYMSKGVDLERWSKGPGTEAPLEYENRYSVELGRREGVRTYLVYVKKEVEEEEHDNLIERFILLEGECNVRMGEKVVTVKGESYFEIPLHTKHSVEVTSEIPCKFICQRVYVD